MIDRARAEDALAASEQRFRALVENSTDGILLIDAGAVILYAGPSTARILGHGDDLIGKRVDETIHPDDVMSARLFHGQLVAGADTIVRGEVRIRHADGRWRSIEAVATNLLHDPAVAAIVINYRDITDRKDAEQQLERLAYRDSLTDLPNRFLFHDRLRHAIDQAERRAHGLAVLYLDLDRFKLVNDTLGHSVGDELLQSVAVRLRQVLRADDTIARLGGDEFAILLPEVDRPEDAGSVAGKVLTALRAPFTVAEHQLYATVSIGLSIYPTDGEDVVTLLKNADSALYRSKELGRNNVQLFAASMNARYMRRLDLEVALRTALEREELEMHYQPIIDRRTGTIRSFEALMRCRWVTGR
jgi:diguanylate cyclase (GGDEF)-like protein/PAS domain S-box-containing protein